MPACPACGHENRAEARFCDSCGASLTVEPAREERKIVTVLFADLVGFTSRAERMDPEDVRELLAPYHARLRSELERYGGTVEKFIGDAVMALFGAPVAHEDDPERAVRAAFAIRDWVLEDEELQLRIAVNTGEALVALGARPESGEGMASGDVVNSTARLQSAAPVNGILVGESTYRATRDVIDYRETGAVEAKGKAEPIPAWEATAPRSELGVDVVQTGRTPLIGREQELTLLVNTAQRVRDDREPQLVTLVGVPGIGKSRLTFELFNTLADDGVIWRQGRCLPYGDGVAFWAIGEIVKSHAEIFESDAANRAEQKLLRTVAATVSGKDDAAWVARYLRPLIGLGGDSGFRRESATDAFAAWRRFFEAVAESDPLVLVIEDLHWADDDLLDFVDHLVDWTADVPLLVVCTARPELFERRPDWGGGKANATTLSLRPLSDEDTARLLAANLDRPVLEAEVQGALLERAGGNPLYAEQYARMLAERYDSEELSVPETVQAIVAARLDGLSAEEKELLHDAAVHGKVFWAGAVAAMAGGDRTVVEERLHGLGRKEFVRRQRRSAIAGETEYVFRHMLVRGDVAYGQIPRRARAEKHRLAAEWIDSLVEDRDDHVELLADHYGRALEFARAAGDDEALIAERARLAFREAGKRAFALGAFDAAVRFRRQALELWPVDDHDRSYLLLELADGLRLAEESGREEAAEARDALLALGDREKAAHAEAVLSDVTWMGGNIAAGREHAERALELARDLPASRSKAEVYFMAAFLHFMRGDMEATLAQAHELRRMTEEIGDDEFLSAALHLIGGARIQLGDLGGLEDGERSLALGREVRSPFVPVGVGNIASWLLDLGRLERAFELAAEAREEVTRLGNRPMIAFLGVIRMREQYWTGAWDEATRLADELITGRTQHDYRARTVRGQMWLARDRVQDALDDTAEALEGGRAVLDLNVLHPALALHARASLALGARTAALEAVHELLEQFATGGTLFPLNTVPDLAIAAVDLDRADAFRRAIATLKQQTPWIDAARAFAEGDFAGAAAIYAQIGSLPDAAYARLRAARALVEQGRAREAEEPLQDALAFFRSVGAIRYIVEGEALLAATA